MNNTGSGSGGTDKKDLTGLHELPPADPLVQEGASDFSANEAPSIEQVEHFESLDQIGMMDHPVPPEETAALESPALERAPAESVPPEVIFSELEMPPSPAPDRKSVV